jgi:hypothetical protein
MSPLTPLSEKQPDRVSLYPPIFLNSLAASHKEIRVPVETVETFMVSSSILSPLTPLSPVQI